MVVNTKLTVEGTTYSDPLQIEVESNIGDFNATSNFFIEFNNFNGVYDDEFSLNDEVIVYADLDTDPATTKIFVGIVEDISYAGVAADEIVTIKGRDFGAVLQDMTVQPVVYKDRDAGAIAKIIIAQNSSGLVTTNNVNVATGTTIERMPFNHKNLFDALKELAELSGCIFYVDTDKDVHFELAAGTSSGLTFNNTNVTNGKFHTSDKEIFNKVWVYGDRRLTGMTDTFAADGTGSVFTLTDKAHNTRVTSHDVLIEKGGILDMDNPATESGIKYLVNFNEKLVVFVSGTAAGDNIPASGTLPVQVDYERSSPILKFRQDATSIAAYGPKTKVIVDRGVKDFSFADQRATTFLADNKDPKIMGDIDVKGVLAVTPGETAVVDLPWQNISSQTYTMISALYSFNKRNNLHEKVLHITLNKKLGDFTDTLKTQILRINEFETGPLEGTLSRLETATRFVDVDNHWEVWAGSVGNSFIFHSATHGVLNSGDSRITLGDMRGGHLGSHLIQSGGGF